MPNKNIFFLLLLLCCIGCGGNYTPKPKVYIRIDLPEEKNYHTFDTFPYPYTFEVPSYAVVVPDVQEGEKYWLDIKFPGQNSNVYLSYKDNRYLDSNISATLFYLEKHIAKSTGIEQIYYDDFDNKVYGTIFYIKGRDVASTMQFYLTDSNRHFVRGAFYINTRPNNDSLAPIIDFIQDDIKHLIQTWRWKK